MPTVLLRSRRSECAACTAFPEMLINPRRQGGLVRVEKNTLFCKVALPLSG